jgi:hypothetical protein
MGREIYTRYGEDRTGSNLNWIKILFIFYLVYKGAKKFCERAQGPEPFTRPRPTHSDMWVRRCLTKKVMRLPLNASMHDVMLR